MFVSCNGQEDQKVSQDISINTDSKTQNKIPLPENGFFCRCRDSKGYLCGSRGNGVFKFDGNSFINNTMTNGLCDNDVSSIAEDKKGNLWFGNTIGVCRFDGKKFKTKKAADNNGY